MIINPYPGTYFAFEGIDGCGKTTLVDMFLAWLGGIKHLSVRRTKEPDKNGLFGRRIYEDLSRPNGLHVTNPALFQGWYACDSLINIRDNVIPVISKKNGAVVSDRSRLSMIYGAKNIQEVYELLNVNNGILGVHFIWPDAIFVLDVSVEVAIDRLKRKGRTLDGHESEDKLKTARELYKLVANPPEDESSIRNDFPNCHLINAEREIDITLDDVLKIAVKILNRRGQLAAKPEAE
ncbi:MAG: hypothetical protein UW14_C0002G0033 [Candidatus Yanofskybacteria bacterium GW2011_GWA2_44_10]|nr:MAG: hypothetical protein UW14_C0002G0033 [Candidatus Yanofskybacteria bacterium GW2011_GWA2_44_10]